MTKLLVKNKKISESGNLQESVYNFGIPAYYSKRQKLATCPMAGQCKVGCYAQAGAYNFSNVANAYKNRLEVTLSNDFIDLMTAEINVKLKTAKRQQKQLVIRIHDSGDFYSVDYLNKWLNIIQLFPEVQFYAYTKMVPMFKSLSTSSMAKFQLPNNFTVIYSFGGKADHLINRLKDRHSDIFGSLEQLLQAGYDNVTKDDTIAYKSVSGKVGLVYHGFKSKEWTTA